MKTILVFPILLALPAFAGPSAKEMIAPAQAPCLYNWFTGGSVGYLTEFEEAMYNLHVGTDTCWNLAGWNLALFAEIGYTEKDEDYAGSNESILSAPPIISNVFGSGGSVSLSELESALAATAANSPFNTGYDLDIMPITVNAKLERNLTGNLNAYFGAGLGVARVDLSVNNGFTFSDADWVFTAQIFAGLSCNVTQNFEVYGGARWIYFDDAKLSDSVRSATLELDDDLLLELGGRFNF